MARWIKNTLAKQQRSPAKGGQIRSYVDGRGAKDARTDIEQDFDQTLDGDLDAFLRAALANKVKP